MNRRVFDCFEWEGCQHILSGGDKLNLLTAEQDPGQVNYLCLLAEDGSMHIAPKGKSSPWTARCKRSTYSKRSKHRSTVS